MVSPEGDRVLERVQLVPEGKGFFDEAWLQQLIHRSPACLPIGEIDPALGRFTAICREMPVSSGYIDNLLMTGTGDIALVETKLFRSPEARRQVVAQALDYATRIFALTYDQFERAVLTGSFAPAEKPVSLYAALPEAEKLDEAAFADAVAHNLRRGRALILIAGDGIRHDAEALLEGMHAHARFGFTLALIELGVFRVPEAIDHFLVRPRTLAKTAIVQRTIIELVGSGASVKEERTVVPSGVATETYWDALEAKIPGARTALETLVTSAAALGVEPELLGSLNLRWQRPDSKPVNLGYVDRRGQLWTDPAAWFVPPELARAYVEDVAQVFGCSVSSAPDGTTWNLRSRETSKAPRISEFIDRLSDWLGPIQRFIAAIQEFDASVGT